MFKSFFPKPGPFFMSAFVWALIAVIFWQAGGGDWVARLVGASDEVPISAARFWSLDYLIFYAYYLICVGLFATFWFIYSPHRWHYYAFSIGLIFILNGVVGLLGFEAKGWQTYGVGLVTWIISFWLAGFIIRRREEDEVKDAR